MGLILQHNPGNIKTYSALLSAQFGARADAPKQSEYVVFSMDYLQSMIATIRENTGVIFGIALCLFIFLLGVKLVFDIIDWLAG